jgi:hypothetical protein
MRILLAVCFSTATRFAFHNAFLLRDLLFSLRDSLRRVVFHVHPECPYKTKQFSPDGGYDLLLVLARCDQTAVALVQTMLCFPGDFFHLWAEPLLPFSQSPTRTGTMSIRPGCFHRDPAQVSITGLGYGSAHNPPPTRVFAGNRAAVTHQLSSVLESRQLAHFGHDGDR